MKFNIHGKKIKITGAINDYIEEKLSKLNKYLENPNEITAKVMIFVKGKDQTIEVTIPVKGFILRAEETNVDLYAAIDLVLEKLERQIKKNKTRMKKKINKNLIDFVIDFQNEEEEEMGKIVKRKLIETKPMNEEEAILQMNLLDHNFFIFKNSETDITCVLYRRKDNDYGVIEVK